MALPILGLWLLIAKPRLDVIWENHAYHFGLVAGVAGVNMFLGLRVSEAARRRGDARLFLVSLAFLSSAGFLLLHALATPGVLLSGKNGGFVLATPVGLLVASMFVATSSIEFSPRSARALMLRQNLLRGAVVLLLAFWALLSLLNLSPLRAPIPTEEARGPLAAVTIIGVILYAVAGLRYYILHRRRPAVMLIGVITAFVLLAEAMVAVLFARNWATSWWEWHVLMGVAFAFVAYSAHVEYSREGSSAGLFQSISLERTLREIREEYGGALEAVVAAMQRRVETGAEVPIRPLTSRLADRFGLGPGQVEVLEQAAEALAHEREQILRLGGLVAVGRETRVVLSESELLRRAVALAEEAFRGDRLRVGLVEEGALRFPQERQERPAAAGARRNEAAAEALRTLRPVQVAGDTEGSTFVLPLTVKGQPAGVLEVERAHGRFVERDVPLLESLASQLSIAVENARLYRQIDALFRSYMSPDVATSLLADPTQAALGGAEVEVTVLFADLRGFTAFSERSSPEQVVAMLNRYFSATVPLILEEGGTVVQFVGDALMAIFNAPVRQPDHALRAARAALAMQRTIQGLPGRKPGWPRFRMGINTGPVLVGNIGSAEMRNFTAIGDTTNLAARLEAVAEEGQVVIGGATYAAIRDLVEVRSLGHLEVKGKSQPVEAYELLGLLR